MKKGVKDTIIGIYTLVAKGDDYTLDTISGRSLCNKEDVKDVLQVKKEEITKHECSDHIRDSKSL